MRQRGSTAGDLSRPGVGVVLVELGLIRRLPGGQVALQGRPVDQYRATGLVVAPRETSPELLELRFEDVQLDPRAGGSANGQELVSFLTRP